MLIPFVVTNPISRVVRFSKHYPERMGQIVLLDPPSLFYGIWYGVQSVLDPVTKSKVVMMRGAEALRAYSDVQWRGVGLDRCQPVASAEEQGQKATVTFSPDPGLASWVEAIAEMRGFPGSFPSTREIGGLRDATSDAALCCAIAQVANQHRGAKYT